MIRTDRLDLVPITPGLARADLAGPTALGTALGVEVPPTWPPTFYDAEAVRWTLARLEEQPEVAGWWSYYVVLREPVLTLVGVVGYKGPPDAGGAVEVGYGVVADHQRRGLASEATAALVARAFATPGVTRVLAETLPALTPSIGVLERLGFRLVGDGSEPGVIRYALDLPPPV